VAEGAPLLREYVGKTCIKGSNPFDSASDQDPKGLNLQVQALIAFRPVDVAHGSPPCRTEQRLLPACAALVTNSAFLLSKA
jgi:hypothetical protein